LRKIVGVGICMLSYSRGMKLKIWPLESLENEKKVHSFL
jgi:hypothetical protein